MKIAILCRRYHPEVGGVETHVKEIAERLAKQHEVIIFTLVNKKRLVGEEVINNVCIKRFKSLKFSYSLEIPPRCIISEIEKFNPRILHAHNAHTVIPFFASRSNSSAKLVVTPHYLGRATSISRNILSMVYKPLLNSALSKANLIISVSPVERNMLIRDFSFQQEKIRVIPNGVGTDLIGIASNRPTKDSIRILSVARFDLNHKKTDVLIRAMKILESRNIDSRLVLVGSGADKQKIIELISELGLTDRIELRSNLARDELVQEYARATLFVSASEVEAYSIAIAEAVAARLPVVVPNSAGSALFVQTGQALGIRSPISPISLAEGIVKCVSNKFYFTHEPAYTWDMATKDLEYELTKLVERN